MVAGTRDRWNLSFRKTEFKPVGDLEEASLTAGRGVYGKKDGDLAFRELSL